MSTPRQACKWGVEIPLVNLLLRCTIPASRAGFAASGLLVSHDINLSQEII